MCEVKKFKEGFADELDDKLDDEELEEDAWDDDEPDCRGTRRRQALARCPSGEVAMVGTTPYL